MNATTNTPFEAIAEGAAPGLVGTITVEVYDPSDGAVILPETTAGITEPQPGTYRVMLTVPVAGTFSIRWETPDGNAEEPLTVSASPTNGLPPVEKPTNADVAAILRARTKDLDGAELGVFTENTRPTADEVDYYIDLAYSEVTGEVGTYLGSRCSNMARSLVAVRAAAWVELSYWPEQIRSDRSVYAELIDRWTEGITSLRSCVEGNAPGDGEDAGNLSYRFGVLDVHGWTASPYYGAPVVPLPEP